MGVDYTAYLQFGVKLKGIPEIAEELQNYDLVIVDGMCGKYSVIGPVLASADLYDGATFTDIDTSADSLFRAWSDYKEKFIENMGVDRWDNEWEPKLIFYVHMW